LQRTIGNHAVQRILKAEREEGKGNSTTVPVAHCGHDFSQVPVAPPHRIASTSADANNPGIRSIVKRDRHTFSVAIGRVSAGFQNDSMGGNERGAAANIEEQPTGAAGDAPASSTAEAKEGVIVRFSTLPALEVPSQWDAIRSTLAYNPSTNPVNPPATPTKFGETSARIEVNKSSGKLENGVFLVELVIENVITYWVAGGTRRNIASDTDPNITQSNYPTVASDLTPSPRAIQLRGVTLLKNQPPRWQFWARDLTIEHELYHADDNVKWGRQAAVDAQKWLDRQTAQTLDQVEVLVGRAARMVAQRLIAAKADPAAEQNAYDNGAAGYTARAQAIKTKGDARGYVPRSPAPKVPSSPPASP
jgi:hypothetical protein